MSRLMARDERGYDESSQIVTAPASRFECQRAGHMHHALAARIAPEFPQTFFPRTTEGAGNAGVISITRSLACSERKHTSKVTTGESRHAAFPARWFYGFLRALPGVHDVLVTVACRSQRVRPARADIALLTDLTPAKGRQDHTTSPSASTSLVWQHQRVHRIPRPTLVTIAKRPSLRARDGAVNRADLGVSAMAHGCGRLARRAICA
jgi:hypothetical protein